MPWVLLFVAGVFETVWALALKESDGFSKLGPTLVFLTALVASMVLLALALRTCRLAPGTPSGPARERWELRSPAWCSLASRPP